jgi:mannosyltransferase OCH1-like enzyme
MKSNPKQIDSKNIYRMFDRIFYIFELHQFNKIMIQIKNKTIMKTLQQHLLQRKAIKLIYQQNRIKQHQTINQQKLNHFYYRAPKNIIPPLLFQTWYSKELPPFMAKAVQNVITSAPGFKHQLFDDADCRKFIDQHYGHEVLNAYDSLIPGAYKADLWRYCILYRFGGIYLDIKYIPFQNFNFNQLLDKERFVLDLNKKDIYNALMIVRPNNDILREAINIVIKNVKRKFYGAHDLEPTGPKLLGGLIKDKRFFALHHELLEKGNLNKRAIFFNKQLIFISYPEYLKEFKTSNTHYSEYWINRNVYTS